MVDKMSKMMAVSGNEIEREDAQPSSANTHKFFYSLCIPRPVQLQQATHPSTIHLGRIQNSNQIKCNNVVQGFPVCFGD